MSLSIVVPTHNKRAYLRATLATLARQVAASPDTEVIVVDDGSTDGTAADLAAEQGRAERGRAGSGPAWLRVVRTPHVGLAGARNAGARAALGEHVLFVDDDVVLGDGCLAALARHVAAAPDRVHVGNLRNVRLAAVPALLAAAAQPGFAGFGAPGGLDAHAEYHSMYDAVKVLFANAAPDAPRAAWWAVVTGGNLCVPRTALLAAGGFDESFRRWGPEDADLCYRLFLAGIGASYHPDCALYHLDHPRDAATIYMAMMRNAGLLYKRHGKPPELLAYLRFFNGMTSLGEFNAAVAERHGLPPAPDVPEFRISMRDVTQREHVIAWGRT